MTSTKEMIHIKQEDIVTPELMKGAILHNGHIGFLEDYSVLHSLARKYAPKTFFEVGTNTGIGTKIIKNALGENSKVFTLDLPVESLHGHLVSGGRDLVGSECTLPFVQLRGDSTTFDFSKYPCEGYWIDAEHTEENVFKETSEILKLQPNIIIWHDTDMEEVMRGLLAAIEIAPNKEDYLLFRVDGTRISYLIKKDVIV